MRTQSVWDATANPLHFPPLEADLTVDVAVVGGGITGMTTAAVLAAAGLSVAILEAHTVGSGTTGNSTGNLYAPVGSGLSSVARIWGEETARNVAESRREAIRFIEETVRSREIPCSFGRVPFFLAAGVAERKALERLEAEFDVLDRFGFPVRWVDSLPAPVPVQRAIALEDQAQFHPLEYVRRLAQALSSERCRIYERSAVVEVDRAEGVLRVGKHTVRANQVVLATHTPKGFNLVQTEIFPYREYGVALKLRTPAGPHGIYWAQAEEKVSVRFLDAGDARFVLAVGGDHKVGHGDPSGAASALESFLRKRFEVAEPAYRWSGQHYRPADGLPLIGPSPAAEKVWIATGFSKDGLVYGTLAGRLLGEAIARGSSTWGELYRARRITPVKSVKDFLKENADVAGHYVKDYLAGEKARSLEEVKPGEGRLVDVEGRTLAVHRRGDGSLVALSPTCTHLKCRVRWNPVERSWDCPCHGSRFAWDGSVLEGPALHPLERISL